MRHHIMFGDFFAVKSDKLKRGLLPYALYIKYDMSSSRWIHIVKIHAKKVREMRGAKRFAPTKSLSSKRRLPIL